MTSFSLLLVGTLSILACLQHNTCLADDEARTRETCIKEGKLTPDEAKIVEGDYWTVANPSKNVKCYSLCKFKTIGAIDANGKSNGEAILKYMDPLVSDKTKITPMMQNCATKLSTSDPCESIYAFEKCVKGQL